MRRRALAASLAAVAVLGIFAVFAGLEWRSAQRGLATATQIANTLVFDLGQDRRMSYLPAGMMDHIYDRAIQGYDEIIK